MATATELNVSLEHHLAEALRPLVNLLPGPVNSALVDALNSPEFGNSGTIPAGDAHSVSIISYSLLSSISGWARSSEGLAALRRCDPPLEPAEYSMVALLSGTRTSPERKFARVANSKDQTDSHDELADRRAITAVINALLSILGSGAATWWAADKLQWRDEWRVLLALLVAIVVAIAEAGLYLILDSRRSKTKPIPRRKNSPIPHTPENFSSRAAQISPPNEPTHPSPEHAGSRADSSVQTSQDLAGGTSNLQTHVTAENLRVRTRPA